jgi:predicted transcriptional regulator of viral defense system
VERVTHDGLPETSRLAGVVTTAELEQAGITDARIRVLVRRGVLVSLGRGVYARTELAGQIGDRTLRLSAALAVAGPGAVASHYDAALIHGLALLERPPANVSSVSHPRGFAGGRARRPGVRVHLVSLPPGQVTTASGVPVTTVARTVVDLAQDDAVQVGRGRG